MPGGFLQLPVQAVHSVLEARDFLLYAGDPDVFLRLGVGLPGLPEPFRVRHVVHPPAMGVLEDGLLALHACQVVLCLL